MNRVENISSRLSILAEFLSYLWHRRLWWMIPMLIVFLGFGLLLVFAQGSPLAPFIYTLF